jgi:predicted aspartyl protease
MNINKAQSIPFSNIVSNVKNTLPSLRETLFTPVVSRLLASLFLLFSVSACELVDMAKFSYANSTSKHNWSDNERSTLIPFQLINNHIIIPVSINGSKPLNFVLDSGAGATVIVESKNSRLLPLKSAGKITISGAGAGFESIATIAEDVKVNVGPINLLGQSVINIPLTAIPFFDEIDEVYFDGIIGYDFLRRFVVEINYDEMVMIVSEADEYQPALNNQHKNWQQLPLEIVGNMPFLEATIGVSTNTSVKVKLLVDTGSTGAFSLLPDTHDKLLEQEKYFTRTAQGLTGDIDSRVSTFDFLSLGKLQLKNITGSYSMTGGTSENGSNGLLGNQALNRFNLIFDYQNNHLFMQPNHRFNMPISPDRSGLRVMPHTLGGIVKDIAAGTTATNSNLEVGDIVTRFNGEVLTAHTIGKLYSVLTSSQDAVRLCWLRDSEENCEELELVSRY